MSYEIHPGYALFKKAKEDRRFMTLYYNEVTSTNHFNKVMKQGVIKPKSNHQEFEGEIFDLWDQYLIDSGRATPQEKQIADKWSVARAAFDILSGLDLIEFKILDAKKYIGAIKEDGIYFQVTITRHNKPVVESGIVDVAANVKDYVRDFADKLSDLYSVVKIKNNQVTVEDDNQNQTSIKITRKKEVLF